MSTSGTLATTVIDNSALLEHAFRRCKIPPSGQTPETIQIASECLYMLLLNMSNRGLNLWCVDKTFIGLIAGQPTYSTPVGTLDVLNVVYCQPTLVAGSFLATVTGGKTVITSSGIVRVGFTVSASFTGALVISSSSDDATYTQLLTLPVSSYVVGQTYWYDLPALTTAAFFKVDSASAPYPVISSILTVSASSDLVVSPQNRDTYVSFPNKANPGRPSTNFFYEKKLIPTITLWPVPNNNTDHLMIYRHRQAQDVGTLTQQLEIPQRWLDGFVWLLAAALCYELPNVEDARIQMVVGMADKQVFEAEGAESDGMPTYLLPGIGAYSR